jgi:hypothetical protein
MGNQYSITVSDETHAILTQAKEKRLKVSQIVDIAVKTLGLEALMRLQATWRQSDSFLNGETYE